MPKYKNETPALPPFEEEIVTLLLGKDLYSLDIAKAYEEISGRKVSLGSLYATLRKLERKKFIEARWGSDEVEERSGGRRRYYNVTGLGGDVLREVQLRRQKFANWQLA